MVRLLSFVLPLIAYASAFAAEPQDAPPQQVGTLGIVLFLVLFFGMIIGFTVYLWWHEKKRRGQVGKQAE